MTDADWWANMLQGSVGSVIGLIGVFVALWLTLRADKKKDLERARVAEQRARDDRTAAAAGEVLFHLSGPPIGRRPASEVQAWVDRASQSMLLFFALERRDHPHVAGWMLAAWSRLQDRWQAYLAALEEPTDATDVERRIGDFGKEIGTTFGIVTNWVTGKYADEWFRGRDHELTDM